MRIFDIDSWNEVWITITRNRKRSIMTALGIYWGIFMLTIMLGAGEGLGRMFRGALGDMAINTILMSPQRTGIPYEGMPKGRHWRMDNSDVDAVRQLDVVKYATPLYWGNSVKTSRGNRKGEYQMMGYAPDFQKISPVTILHGRYINDIDMAQKRKVCVIGEQIVKELMPEVANPVGETLIVNSAYYTIVGVVRKLGTVISFSDIDKTIIVPISLAQQTFNAGSRIHTIAIAGEDTTPSKEVSDAARRVIYERHTISPNDEKAIWTMATAEMFDSMQALFGGISLLTWIVGLGTLFAGIVGVSNIMLVLVKERTQEIGIRRAIGAPPSAIITQILSESFVLTFVAGVFGLAAAVGVLSVADEIYYQNVTALSGGKYVSWQITFAVGVISLIILILGSLLAGVIPAVRALKIKAIDAIREE